MTGDARQGVSHRRIDICAVRPPKRCLPGVLPVPPSRSRRFAHDPYSAEPNPHMVSSIGSRWCRRSAGGREEDCGERDEPQAARRAGGYPHLQAGQAGRGRGSGRLQAVLEREPVPPAARCAGERDRGRRLLQPLPGHVVRRPDGGAGGALRGAGRPCGHRHGLGGRRPAADPGDQRPRRRGDLRLAVVRGVPDHHADQRGPVGTGAAHVRRGARSGRDGRGDHRPDAADLRLQPEQSDRHGGAAGRAGALPRPGAPGCAGGAGRGLPGVHPRPRGARRRRAVPGAAQCLRSADVLQGVRPGRAAGRLRDRP
ncbi:hypothetical protein SGPA1_50205 [Streptomyces misionensis JCM 4497]